MIEMNKKYKTRDGKYAVRVLCNDANGKWSVVAMFNDAVYRFSAEGLYGNEWGHHLDLIEVSEWADFKIDDPVMVRDGIESIWIRRNFAGTLKQGVPTTWVCGTAWSSNGARVGWNFCRRPTEEELK